MKKIVGFSLFLLVFAGYYFSMSGSKVLPERKHPVDFNQMEHRALHIARQIIKRAYYGSLVTIDKNGTPKVRLMEPFAPDSLFVIYLATNPNSRKAQEIKHNHTVSLHYVDEPRTGYVSLYGKAFIVNDDSLKQTMWKEGWQKFYPNRDKDYMLIKFVPDYLELISIRDQITGDKKSWHPLKVDFLKQ